MARLRIALPFAMLVLGATLLGAALAQGEAGVAKPKIRNGGTFRITVAGETSSVDPAAIGDAALVEATCARLMTYPDKPPPRGYRLVPEVASGFGVSRDGKTYTFTLRRSFRFSNGAPVRASAFAWAFTRILRLNENIDAISLLQEIVGASRVRKGTAQTVAGITARGNRLVIRLTQPAPDFPARMTVTSFCAVPPACPPIPKGSRPSPRPARTTWRRTCGAAGSCSSATAFTVDRGHTTSTASSPRGERARSPTCSTGSSGVPPTGASRRRRSTSIRAAGWPRDTG